MAFKNNAWVRASFDEADPENASRTRPLPNERSFRVSFGGGAGAVPPPPPVLPC